MEVVGDCESVGGGENSHSQGPLATSSGAHRLVEYRKMRFGFPR